MISSSLPSALKAALDAKLDGFSRGDAAARAAAISRTYRDGGGSDTIRSDADALAYALARMPATYAAVGASLNALAEIRPDFSPHSLLDIGAGPGTASFAAAEAFPSLQSFALLDRNDALRSLALELARSSARFDALAYMLGEARSSLAQADAADLVIASYMIGELSEAERRELGALIWSKTRDTLVVLEPGTPAGYARVMMVRAELIALGAHVAAPCPHDAPCPLAPPDWCHFAQRLARSRVHKQIKGAALPFEDEKFSYVVLTRAPVAFRPARVLAQPAVGKVEVAAKLCTTGGVVLAKVPRRDRGAYASARRWRWGDAVVTKADRLKQINH
jgi:ribosomal protein RSM22 (predicted rRNA methylase)